MLKMFAEILGVFSLAVATQAKYHVESGNSAPCSISDHGRRSERQFTVFGSPTFDKEGISRSTSTSLMIHGGGVRTETQGNVENDVQRKLERTLRPRASYHIARKTFHFFTIMGLAVMYSAKGLSQRDFAGRMLALDTCVLAGELLRLRVKAVNRFLLSVFGAFMRVHELKKFSGIMYCLAGLGITSALFPTHIALLATLQLALGDPMAALFGHATRFVRWSRLKSGKGVLGAVGCAVVLTAMNSLVLARATFSGVSPPSLAHLVLAGWLIAVWTAAVELAVPSPQMTLPCDFFPLALDDNAMLPVLCAVGAVGVFRLLGLGECRLTPWILW